MRLAGRHEAARLAALHRRAATVSYMDTSSLQRHPYRHRRRCWRSGSTGSAPTGIGDGEASWPRVLRDRAAVRSVLFGAGAETLGQQSPEPREGPSTHPLSACQASSPTNISALLPYFWVMPMACLLASMMLGSLIAACMSSCESQVPTNIT